MPHTLQPRAAGIQPVGTPLVTSFALGIHPRVVMEIVGHSAMEMTMNVYGHVQLDTRRAALDRLDDELSG
jgi:integrase